MNQAPARIIDVNLNRLTEALKVLEDVVRFATEKRLLLRRIRALRQEVNRRTRPLRRGVIASRQSERDPGRGDRFDRTRRKSLEDVLMANFKRAEEAARVLEELFKMSAAGGRRKAAGRMRNWPAWFKEVRFRLYDLEKVAVAEEEEVR
ncbi:MAG: hypothetical protein ABIK44_00515 [candidate division WOR-3 bacterium]